MFHVLLVSVWEILDTRAVKVFPVKLSTVNVADCPTFTLPISVSSTLASICLLDKSAMRMMTVGLLLPCTAMVPGVCGSPTTTPDMGATMVISFILDWDSAKEDTAVS